MGHKYMWRAKAALLLTAIVSGTALAAPITVDSVGTLDPNPNTLTIVDAPSNSAAHGVTLSTFQSLMTSAYANDKGGVMDFQEQFQGGSWPNNPRHLTKRRHCGKRRGERDHRQIWCLASAGLAFIDRAALVAMELMPRSIRERA